MGTSKAYNGKGIPNWSNLSGSVTTSCDIGIIPYKKLKALLNF